MAKPDGEQWSKEVPNITMDISSIIDVYEKVTPFFVYRNTLYK